MKQTQGFTLVEVIIVISILLVLSTLAVVSIRGFIEEGERTRTRADAEQLAAAFNMYNATLSAPLTDEHALLAEKSSIQAARLWPALSTPEDEIDKVLALIRYDDISCFFIVP